jgi:hypothetical protein
MRKLVVLSFIFFQSSLAFSSALFDACGEELKRIQQVRELCGVTAIESRNQETVIELKESYACYAASHYILNRMNLPTDYEAWAMYGLIENAKKSGIDLSHSPEEKLIQIRTDLAKKTGADWEQIKQILPSDR